MTEQDLCPEPDCKVDFNDPNVETEMCSDCFYNHRSQNPECTCQKCGDMRADYCPQCGKQNVYVEGGDSIIRQLVESGQLSRRYLQ